ncbi:glycosyltransferase family 4 protein [Ochrobactrum pseudogrignonense]|nr:glycosyltransferase family 4 protein [Brucella pseudogrignonensis]
MPSLYEGFGLPIIEAQQYGTPVISSILSSMPEVTGAGEFSLIP